MAGSFLKKLLKMEHAGIVADLAEKAVDREIYAGDPALDWATKGWHGAGINLIYGPSGCGKSAIALKSAAEVWKKNPDKSVLIYDSEFYYYKNKKNLERIADFGIPLDKVIMLAENTIDELFSTLNDVEQNIKEGSLDLAAVIIDSLGGIQNINAENKIMKGESGAAGDAHRGNAKSMNPILGVWNRITAKNDLPVFAVQHCIKNQEQYGDKWVLLGGERLKFLSQRSLCVESSAARDGKLCAGDVPFDPANPDAQVVGKKILAKCMKTRGGMEGGKVEFWFNFNECRFARPEVSLFTLASKLGVIYHPTKDGKTNNVWWAYSTGGGELKAQGAAKMQELLAGDAELFRRVYMECRTSTKSAASDEQMSGFVDSDSGTSSKEESDD